MKIIRHYRVFPVETQHIDGSPCGMGFDEEKRMSTRWDQYVALSSWPKGVRRQMRDAVFSTDYLSLISMAISFDQIHQLKWHLNREPTEQDIAFSVSFEPLKEPLLRHGCIYTPQDALSIEERAQFYHEMHRDINMEIGGRRHVRETIAALNASLKSHVPDNEHSLLENIVGYFTARTT